MGNLLNIQHLNISFLSDAEENQVIHNISFGLNTNEILGIVGESGSGKSVSALAILGLPFDILPTFLSRLINRDLLMGT